MSYAVNGQEQHSLAYVYPNRMKIRRYFRRLLTAYNAETEPCLFLPSFMELSKQLDCSPLDLHLALAELRKQGYDYFTLNIYGPITLWHPSRIQLCPDPLPL